MGKDPGFSNSIPETNHLLFRDFFERFYRPLLGFFLKRSCTETESEDLVQETLLNAYRGFDRFRHDASDTTWVFSIAGNVWLNHLRSRRTQKRASHPVSLEQFDSESDELAETAWDSPGSSALDRLIDEERRSQLRKALSELPEGRRQVLHLRIVHGLKYREIAHLLSIEVNTVKSQVFQARKQLEEKLGSGQLVLPAGKGNP